MPNWTMISVRFDGDENEINKMLDYIKGEETIFDFNKVIPMPESLKITEGSDADIAMECFISNNLVQDNELKNKYHITDNELQEYKEFGKIYIENKIKYGYRSWYGWCIANWGTKWNARDASYSNGVLYFEAAWCFPKQVMLKLSTIFPDITMSFEVEYEVTDEIDIFSIKNGNIIRE